MYPNTKKELFLGKKPLEAKKLQPKQLLKAMINCLNEYADESLECDIAEITDDVTDDNIQAIVFALRELIENAYDNTASKLGQSLLKELHVDGTQLDAFSEDDNFVEMITLSNEFTYIKALSNIGDDSFVSTYVIFYIGTDDMIHGYIPMYGNNIFANTDFQLGAAGGNDAEAWDELLEEFEITCDGEDNVEYDRIRFETYAKKYGIERTDNDNNYSPYEYADVLLELNTDYIELDIMSNVILK